jgi:hypothetical protein
MKNTVISLLRSLSAGRTLLLLALTMSLIIGIVAPSMPADAANNKDWITTNIISDANFTNEDSMSVSEIQAFLNKQIGTCDVQGTGKATEYGSSLTRAQYAKSRGWAAPPYVCLNKYYEVPKSTAGSGTPKNNWNKDLTKPSGSKSAAWIIKDAADRYNISPKVLLVKIATESAGPLTSDKWPLYSQYKYAMGSHCPDSGPNGTANCDKKYAGFSIQMYSAAELMRSYLNNMDESWWTLKRPGKGVNGSNYVGWNVAPSGCGGTNLNIANKATAALYTYTPYQPNKAALDNLYGTGNSCSAYGNRNFWRVYVDWFGNSRGTLDLTGITIEKQPFIGSQTTASFTLKNNTDSTINLKRLKIAVRDPQNNNADFDQVDNIKIEKGKSYTYKKNKTFTGQEGDYQFFIGHYDGSSWHYPPFDDYGQTSNGAVTRRITKSPILSEKLSLNVTSMIHNSQTVTATFKVRNPSSYPVNIGRTKVAARDSKDTWLDFPDDGYKTLAAGETYSYQKSRVIEGGGTVRSWIANIRDGYDWSETLPMSSTPGMARSISLPLVDAATLTSPLEITSSKTHGTSTVRGTFTVKNFGTKPVEIGYIKPAVRNTKKENYDLPYSPYITLAAGQSYTYDNSRELPSGQYSLWIANKRNTYDWSDAFPSSETSGMIRNRTVSVKESVTLTDSLKVTMGNPTAGSTATATFKIKNHDTKPIEVGIIKPAARDSKNTWLDFPSTPYLTLQPGQEYSYNRSRVLPSADKVKVWVANKRNSHDWSDSFPASETNGVVRQLQINLKKEARLTKSLVVTNSGNTYTASFTIKNYGTTQAEIGYIKPAVRDTKNKNYDFPYSPYVKLQPGQSYTYTHSRTLPVGDYHLWIANLRNGKAWSETYPASEISDLVRKLDLTV